jgi:hypothetical protein
MDLSPITPVRVVARPVAASFNEFGAPAARRMGLVLRVAVPDSRILT